MTASFGASAAQLYGVASAMLGWRPSDFWDATPAELAAALSFTVPADEPPTPDTIDALRRQFPDNQESE